MNRGIQRVPGVQLLLHQEPARLTGRIVESRHVDLGDIPVTGQRQHWVWVAGLYALGSAFWIAMAIVQPDQHPHDRHVLLTWLLRAFIAVPTIHILLLDPLKRQAK
ncbi:hypothetical protein [Streptomyces sp. NPDC096032]|uniref:hypothetical protein n=1 Tax=Streptomyces sp. NPDC096032 TaxID=3366070 RepID=UPI003815AB60